MDPKFKYTVTVEGYFTRFCNDGYELDEMISFCLAEGRKSSSLRIELLVYEEKPKCDSD